MQASFHIGFLTLSPYRLWCTWLGIKYKTTYLSLRLGCSVMFHSVTNTWGKVFHTACDVLLVTEVSPATVCKVNILQLIVLKIRILMTQRGNCFVLTNMVSLKCFRSCVCVYVCVNECMRAWCVLVYAWTRVCEITMWLAATALNLCKMLGCL